MHKTVAILIFPGVQSLDVTGPMDVFCEANRFLAPDDHYQLEVIGFGHGTMAASNGLSLQAHMLARAGLLDGKTVTTHWGDAADLARLCPSAQVEADRLYVQDGNLYTSAGVTAGIDLSLYLLAQDQGPEVALSVAKRLVVFTQRSGGQSQFSPFLAPHAETTSAVALVQLYVLANLTGDLAIADLAKAANMSARNFSRVFAREAQVTPAEFVERARVDAARVLLESTRAPLKTVAYQCGFRDAQHMRSVFNRRLGVTPQQFRLNFAAPV